MLQSIVFQRVRLTKLCFKDLHFLSRTFADLPNIRGNAQQPNSPTRPAKPPDFLPVQQNGNFSINKVATSNCSLQVASRHWSNKTVAHHHLLSDPQNRYFLTLGNTPPKPVGRPFRMVYTSCRDPEGFSKKGSGTLLLAPDGTLPR